MLPGTIVLVTEYDVIASHLYDCVKITASDHVLNRIRAHEVRHTIAAVVGMHRRPRIDHDGTAAIRIGQQFEHHGPILLMVVDRIDRPAIIRIDLATLRGHGLPYLRCATWDISDLARHGIIPLNLASDVVPVHVTEDGILVSQKGSADKLDGLDTGLVDDEVTRLEGILEVLANVFNS